MEENMSPRAQARREIAWRAQKGIEAEVKEGRYKDRKRKRRGAPTLREKGPMRRWASGIDPRRRPGDARSIRRRRACVARCVCLWLFLSLSTSSEPSSSLWSRIKRTLHWRYSTYIYISSSRKRIIYMHIDGRKGGGAQPTEAAGFFILAPEWLYLALLSFSSCARYRSIKLFFFFFFTFPFWLRQRF